MSDKLEGINGYELSRAWWNFCFENPEMISPNHTALYFFAIEHCNRLGWKRKFGLPTTMAKEAIGIKSYNTYKNTLSDLVTWGFVEMIEQSKNQYSSNIISLKNALSKNDKALDKALLKHTSKQSESIVQSTGESICSINKPLTINEEQVNEETPPHEVFAEKFFSERGNLDRQNILIQIREPEIKKDWVVVFNGHLGTENKTHFHYSEWLKHFRAWVAKKLPELKRSIPVDVPRYKKLTD